MPKNPYLKPQELEYIRSNCLDKTDEQIAKELKRDIRTIKYARRKLGIAKGSKGSIKTDIVRKEKTSKAEPSVSSKRIGQHLTEAQRKEFFKTQLVNSLYYDNLKEQFTESEIKFYLEEFAALSIQFEDILATEKRQIDELIKAEIMGNRILRNIRVAEDEIEKTIEEVDVLRKATDIDNDEDAQERDAQLMNLVRSMHAQAQIMTNDYQKNVDSRNRLLDQLNARRKDRIDQIKKSNTTFVGLIEAFRDRQTREEYGKHMELVRLAKEKKKSEWRKPNVFPDGTKDSILMDEHSYIPEKEIVIMNNFQCKFVNEFKNEKDKKILIIDDELRRHQFFLEVFNQNKLDFASNPSKAIEKIKETKYDLICLDYDLGMNQKGSEFVDHILNKNLCKESKILIHSMNKDGSKKMSTMLAGEREIETVPFEEIVKIITGENNA
jgi:hypothetical protein